MRWDKREPKIESKFDEKRRAWSRKPQILQTTHRIYLGDGWKMEEVGSRPLVHLVVTSPEAVPSVIYQAPDPSRISTSYVERHNLTIRMACRRFTRLTNAFSKKLDSLKVALSLHFAWYNFVRIHRSLRVTPAMAAG